MRAVLLVILFIYIIPFISADQLIAEDVGFVVYCPCMGRFGNQAEQLLGSLLFAKSLNRTLVLPPFINYGSNHIPSLVPFNKLIKVEPLRAHHNVILMDDFMRTHAPKIWPDGEHQFFCYSTRETSTTKDSCEALKGEPFKSFWTTFSISEDKSIFYKPLTTNPAQAIKWNERFPIPSHQVLAFVGAPSPFPTHKEAIPIQRHIELSEDVERKSLDFMDSQGFLNQPYLSMHIRHGPDWSKACKLLSQDGGLTRLFASNQCTGYAPEAQTILEYDTCYPSFESIARRLQSVITSLVLHKSIRIKFVHIATDNHDSQLWGYLESSFPDIKFIMNRSDPNDMLGTITDIYLMANSDAFIGNCISSFSAFPARIRTEQLDRNDTTFYFGQDFPSQRKSSHEEL